MSLIARADSFLRRAVNGVSALLLAAVVCLGVAQVAGRYLFASPIIWSEEAIRLLYVWMILIAAANADHMRITFIDSVAGPRVQFLLRAGRTLIVLALLAVLIQGAWRLNMSFGRDRYVALGIEKSWYWMAGVTGGLLWAGAQISGLFAARVSGKDRT